MRDIPVRPGQRSLCLFGSIAIVIIIIIIIAFQWFGSSQFHGGTRHPPGESEILLVVLPLKCQTTDA
jgi:hypothetical protein